MEVAVRAGHHVEKGLGAAPAAAWGEAALVKRGLLLWPWDILASRQHP